jgi:undecaprenyl-diphosphatase
MDDNFLLVLIKEIVLALAQGLAEIFPISSSGHLIVIGRLLARDVSYESVLFLHLGTLLAIFYFYKKDVHEIITGKAGWRLLAFMAFSFAVTAAVGLAIRGVIPTPLIIQPKTVSKLWLINGAVVISLAAFSPRGDRKMGDLSLVEFLLIGLVQGITALPGISRLGFTLGAALLLRLTWFEALKLSFLLSLPTILFANLLTGLQLLYPVALAWLPIPGTEGIYLLEHLSGGSRTLIISALVLPVSLICGFWALRVLSRFLDRRLLSYFGLYCLAAGLFFLLFLDLL